MPLQSRSKFKSSKEESTILSDNPALDFVRKIANSAVEGSELIQKLFPIYPADAISVTGLENLRMDRSLDKGNLNSKIYYTSLGGLTHMTINWPFIKQLTD
jgi:hypothetical protein